MKTLPAKDLRPSCGIARVWLWVVLGGIAVFAASFGSGLTVPLAVVAYVAAAILIKKQTEVSMEKECDFGVKNGGVPHAVAEFAIEERERLLDKIDEQAREIERLNREAKNDAIAYKAVIERQEELRAELAALKAHPSGVVLPKRREWHPCSGRDGKIGVSEYNKAIDEVARLNSSPVTDGGIPFAGYDPNFVPGSNPENPQEYDDVVDERAAFEAAFPGYKAMLRDNKASNASGYHIEQQSNMFRVWLHCRAALTASAPNQSEQVRDVSAMARVLSDRQADACNVDRDDQWKIYGQDFIEDVTAMLRRATTNQQRSS